jgi:hypothetical protein
MTPSFGSANSSISSWIVERGKSFELTWRCLHSANNICVCCPYSSQYSFLIWPIPPLIPEVLKIAQLDGGRSPVPVVSSPSGQGKRT